MPTLKRVPIWAAETAVDGRQVTEQDVQDVVDSFQEIGPVLKPYVKLGHTENQKLLQEDGLPAGGWVTRLYREGRTILADIAGVPAALAELVTKGAYRRVSSEVFHNIKINGKTYRRALRAVAFLGADTPAIGSLGDIVALGYASDAEVIAYDTPLTFTEETMKKCTKCGEMIPEGADKCAKCGEAFSAAPGVTVNVNTPNHIDPEAIRAQVAQQYAAEVAARNSENEALKAEIAKFKADQEAAQRQGKIDVFTATVDGLIKDAKLVPALKEDAVAIFGALIDKTEALTYSVDGKPATGTPAEMFTAFLSKATKLNVFTELLGNRESGETTPAKHPAPKGAKVSEESVALDQKVKAYMVEHRVEYIDAYRAVSAAERLAK